MRSSSPARPSSRARAPRIGLGVVLGLILGHAVAGALYLAFRDVDREPGEARNGGFPRPRATSTELRTIGLEAMARRDYPAAVAAFEAALESPEPAPDLPELLLGARQLDASSLPTDAASPPAPADPVTETSPPRKAASADRREAPRASVPTSARTAQTSDDQGGAGASTPPAARATPPPPFRPRGPSRTAGPGRGAPESVPVSAGSPPAARARRVPDELPLCPETPPDPSSPYAALPRRCRPRP